MLKDLHLKTDLLFFLRLCVFAFLFLYSFACPESTYAAAPKELFVTLDTAPTLVPIVIHPITNDATSLSKDYVSQLESAFQFDFNQNGRTKVSKEISQKGVPTIRIAIKGRKIQAKLLENPGNETVFGDLDLSGNLEKDRAAIHQLSDKIHEKLFGVKGIASTKILFTKKARENGKELSEVWQSDYDGKNARPVTQQGGYCVTPCYIPAISGKSPGGFLFVSYKTGQPKIYAASLKGGTPNMLFSLAGNQLMPTVSRQRDRLAFISDVTGNPDLFIQDFDPEKGVLGKPRHLYTAPLATQGTPSFSPDGSKIAFVCNKSGTERIYVLQIPPHGTALKNLNPTLISKFTQGNTAPCWSPDGYKIAYCARIGEYRQIVVYDFRTKEEKQLTQGPGNKENPVFAPNSLHLVYNTAGSGTSELYLINLNEPNPVKISSGPGDKRFPAW